MCGNLEVGVLLWVMDRKWANCKCIWYLPREDGRSGGISVLLILVCDSLYNFMDLDK